MREDEHKTLAERLTELVEALLRSSGFTTEQEMQQFLAFLTEDEREALYWLIEMAPGT